MKFILKSDEIIENCIREIRNSMGMTVTIKKEKRSNPQNNLYWAILTVLSNDTGFTTEDLHDRLRVQFLGVERKTIKGTEIVMPVSTTSLNTKTFTEYLDKIYALGNTLNIVLPVPSYYGYEDEK